MIEQHEITANAPKIAKTLGIFAETPVSCINGRIYAHLSFGRIIDTLAQRYERVLICAPTSFDGSFSHRDYEIQAANVEIVPQPEYSSSIAALRHPRAILSAYKNALKRCDHVFVRGMLPYVGGFYLIAKMLKRQPVHWVVGNPVALLQSHRRSSLLKSALSIAYAYQDRFFTRLGRAITRGAFLCNGDELASIYSSPRTHSVVSSTITEDEFFIREDTCLTDPVRILFIGFVRPEKGVEYLLQALPKTSFNRPWKLTIIGPWDQYQAYKDKLDAIIETLGIASDITWEGHISYGPELWKHLRGHDIFVLPTLSEGTPRVLIEARANSLPVIATNVGGIPSSMTNGVDGILVPPKDSQAIADAIDNIVQNEFLRRSIIRSGIESVRKMTVGKFIDTVTGELCNE